MLAQNNQRTLVRFNVKVPLSTPVITADGSQRQEVETFKISVPTFGGSPEEDFVTWRQHLKHANSTVAQPDESISGTPADMLVANFPTLLSNTLYPAKAYDKFYDKLMKTRKHPDQSMTQYVAELRIRVARVEACLGGQKLVDRDSSLLSCAAFKNGISEMIQLAERIQLNTEMFSNSHTKPHHTHNSQENNCKKVKNNKNNIKQYKTEQKPLRACFTRLTLELISRDITRAEGSLNQTI
ncbi:hypothetical protein ROZALSC1DRAFT_25282 [Rozella allomycis CSF55]|uniref:Retrotransposon gag domain-containing protein n=1 Tax=Rozella allomycis (strain CSF55) TaxID=988480 RepID=A0A4P9YBI7_ROZAC|nr:hypothetical protein ROZALSC1DRAFT_25282 [Rozella allomycis CSF55]